MPTWVIAEMQHNPFRAGKEDPTSDDALYSWTLKIGRLHVGSGFSYKEVKLLMQYFNVDSADKLLGKFFQSEKEDAGLALDSLMIQIQHNGNYFPPPPEEIRQRAVVALAKMERPDYSDLDKESVCNAFNEVWDFYKVKEYWLDGLKGEVAKLSEGKVELVDASPNDFKYLVRGPASYLKLVKKTEGQEQKVILGPYSTPIEFVSD